MYMHTSTSMEMNDPTWLVWLRAPARATLPTEQEVKHGCRESDTATLEVKSNAHAYTCACAQLIAQTRMHTPHPRQATTTK